MASILVVDDRAMNREYLCALLRASGHTMLEARDGAEALEMTRTERPALVIADILMPTMDGYQFVRQLRREPLIAATPVIFISGQYADRDALQLARDCGVAEVIVKPAEPETILHAVDRALAAKAISHSPSPDSFEQLHRRLLTDKLARKAEELEGTNRRLSALVALGRRLASERDPKRLPHLFCDAAREIIGANYILAALRDVDGPQVRHIVAMGEDDAIVGSLSSPSVVSSLLALEADTHPVFVPRGDDPAPPENSTPSILHRLTPLIVAPVVTAARRYGVICFGQLVGTRRLDGVDEEFASTLASQFAVAYENAGRYEQIQLHAERLQVEIGQRKRAQERARKLNRELERRVADRTRELEISHEQLRMSERMASLGTLCAGLGHDMGNLLLPIRARLDAIKRQSPAEQFTPHLEAIGQCVQYLQSLTNGLRMLALNVKRPDSPAESTTPQLWQDEMRPLLKSMVPRGMRLKFTVDDGAPPIRISAPRLTQALFNLVSNSVDALRERGTGEIRILIGSTDDRRQAIVTVSDDGPGMTEEVRARVLDPFFTTKRRAFSTGLGMSLVHSIVQNAGGSIHIDSTLGEGTTITLLLPAGVGSQEIVHVAPDQRPVAAISLSDERLRSYAENLMRSLGYETDSAEQPDLERANVWLTESRPQTLPNARDFLKRGEGRRLVVSGAIDKDWIDLGAVHLGEAPRPSELRAKLQTIAPRADEREQIEETAPS